MNAKEARELCEVNRINQKIEIEHRLNLIHYEIAKAASLSKTEVNVSNTCYMMGVENLYPFAENIEALRQEGYIVEIPDVQPMNGRTCKISW